MDRRGVRQVPEGSGEQGKMEKTGCEIICGAPTTLVVKGLMMMLMMTSFTSHFRCQSSAASWLQWIPARIWSCLASYSQSWEAKIHNAQRPQLHYSFLMDFQGLQNGSPFSPICQRLKEPWSNSNLFLASVLFVLLHLNNKICYKNYFNELGTKRKWTQNQNHYFKMRLSWLKLKTQAPSSSFIDFQTYMFPVMLMKLS